MARAAGRPPRVRNAVRRTVTPRALGVIVVSAEIANLSPVLSDHKPAVVELLYPRDPSSPSTEDSFAELRDPAPGFPADGARPENLLRNPGAEEELAHWSVSGDARSDTWREEHGPRSGARFFTGSPFRGGGDASISSGSQVVDLLDAAERTLATHSSGRHDTLRYHRQRAALPIPPGTRKARYTWLSHRKPASGPSTDAVFDDLYLGLGTAPGPSAILGGDLLENPGAEALDTSGLAQRLDLSAHAAELAAGALALRIGGVVRTYKAEGQVTLALELLDGDGSTWGRVELPPVSAAEYTRIEGLVRVPPGASGARLVLEARAGEGEWVFADALFARPERVVPLAR